MAEIRLFRFAIATFVAIITAEIFDNGRVNIFIHCST